MFEPSLQSTRNIARFFPGVLSDRVVSPLLSFLFYIPLFLSLSLSKKPSAVAESERNEGLQKRIRGRENPRHLFQISESSAHPSIFVGKSLLISNHFQFSRALNSYGLHVSSSSSLYRPRRYALLDSRGIRLSIYIYILNFFLEISSCMHFSLFFA